MSNDRTAAREALAAYRAEPGTAATDDRETIADLIADLAHLADLLAEEQYATDGEADPNLDGDSVLATAVTNYGAELVDDAEERAAVVAEAEAAARAAAGDERTTAARAAVVGQRATFFAHTVGTLGVGRGGQDVTGTVEKVEDADYGWERILRVTLRDESGRVLVRDALHYAVATIHHDATV